MAAVGTMACGSTDNAPRRHVWRSSFFLADCRARLARLPRLRRSSGGNGAVGVCWPCLGVDSLSRHLRLPLQIIFGRLSVVTACSLSSGAVFGLLSFSWGGDPWLSFVFGSFLPIAPFFLYFSSTKALRRNIANWKQLQEDGLLTQQQFLMLRRTAVEWYRQRWFGVSSLGEMGKETGEANRQEDRAEEGQPPG